VIRRLELSAAYRLKWQELKNFLAPFLAYAEGIEKVPDHHTFVYAIEGKDFVIECRPEPGGEYECDMVFEGKWASRALQYLFYEDLEYVGKTIHEDLIPGTDTVVAEKLMRRYVKIPELKHGRLLSMRAKFEVEQLNLGDLSSQIPFGFFIRKDKGEAKMKAYAGSYMPVVECDVRASGGEVEIECWTTALSFDAPHIRFMSNKPHYQIELSGEMSKGVLRDIRRWMEEGEPPPDLKEKWGLEVDPRDLIDVEFEFTTDKIVIGGRLKDYKSSMLMFDEELGVSTE